MPLRPIHRPKSQVTTLVVLYLPVVGIHDSIRGVNSKPSRITGQDSLVDREYQDVVQSVPQSLGVLKMNENDQPTVDPIENEPAPNQAVNKNVAAFDKLVDWFIEYDPYEIKAYVDDFRARFPDLSDDDLAQRIIGIKSLKNGLVGAATGIPGFLAMPVTIPTDLLMSWKIQINLALCVAYIYGHDIDNKNNDDLKTDIYMILAGPAAKESLSVLGVEIDSVTKKAVKRYVTRELMSEIWKRIARQIAVRTGRRTAVKLSRMVPLIGAPIGFATDYAAAKSVGSFAREYYNRDFVVSAQMSPDSEA